MKIVQKSNSTFLNYIFKKFEHILIEIIKRKKNFISSQFYLSDKGVSQEVVRAV